MRPSRRQVLRGGLAFAAASALPGVAEAAPRGNANEHFELTETELHLPELDPAHDGLRVAQLSDLHAFDNAPDGRIIAAVRAVNAAKPDVVLLTGDYVTWSRAPIEHLPLVMRGLDAPTYGVLGNHDHYVDALAVKVKIQSLGYAMLQNENTVLRVKGADLTLVGIDDGGTHHANVPLALRGVSRRGSRLVLAHNPPTADMLPPGANLACFSGHTHGGQIFIPGVTRWLMRVARQPYLRGLYEVNGNALYVNRGLGFGAGTHAPRIGSEPEVSLFTLRRAERVA